MAKQSQSSINIQDTINSGQLFLWSKYDTKWYLTNGDDILLVDEKRPFSVSSFQGREFDLFRVTDDFERIISEMSRDQTLKDAIVRFPGLRLTRQDPFQCYISFIVSSNSSIQNIRLTLQKMAKKFGKKTTFDNIEFHTFPTPERLAKATISELLSCGLGYRAKFVKNAAKVVNDGMIDFDSLKKQDYQTTKSELLQVDGIGNKVADCIMLFSLEKLESFPIDRWIVRSLQSYYGEQFSIQGKTLTDKKYQAIHDKIIDYFGQYAGYSQQFLFKLIRESSQKKW